MIITVELDFFDFSWNNIFTRIVFTGSVFKGTVMQIEKRLISDGLRVLKVSWKFRILSIYNFAVISPWNLLFSQKVAYFLSVSIVLSVYKQNFTAQ